MHDLDDDPNVNTSISVDTVRALSALVVQFTRELVCRAIVAREEEEDLKSQTKAWRVSRKQVSVLLSFYVACMDGADMATIDPVGERGACA